MNENPKVSRVKVGYKNYTIEKPEDIREVSGSYYGTVDYETSTYSSCRTFKRGALTKW